MHAILKGRLLPVRLALLASALALVTIGIITIYAVGNPLRQPSDQPPSDLAGFWTKQLRYALLGLAAFMAVNFFNYRTLGKISFALYTLILALLALVLLGKFVPISFIPEINGAHRWLKFNLPGLPALQPSEFCKLFYILALAWYLRYRSNYRNFSALLGPFILTILPMLLILLEPDLGTVLLMLPVLFTMLFIAGAKLRHLLLVVFAALILTPLFWHIMNPYQRIRISAVLLQSQWLRQKAADNPALAKILVGSNFSDSRWETDWGYHLIRSKYAVASGGLAGRGFRRGPFIKYNLLPYRHNDFIFAAIAHQWGFLGCIAVLALYAVFVIASLEIAGHNTDPFARLLAVGILTMFVVEVIINVFMTLGLMPITGLTLPLVSYGGSSLLTHLLAVGLLNNIGRSRPFTVAPVTI